MLKVIIGLTLDWIEKGDRFDLPWYGLRQNNSDSIAAQGAVPLHIPYHHEHIDTYLDTIDGLLIPGGKFDIPPHMYGEVVKSDTVQVIEQRSAFEVALVKAAFDRGMPILGICGGYHVINVALGGSLIQDIPSQRDTPINHSDFDNPMRPSHGVKLDPQSQLAGILGQTDLDVNSLHHQAIKDLGQSLTISGTAPDGLPEAIESNVHAYCLGVQWHPEFFRSDQNDKIFQSFIQAAQDYKEA